jgi:predicted GNAT superfamily acetyltransferase
MTTPNRGATTTPDPGATTTPEPGAAQLEPWRAAEAAARAAGVRLAELASVKEVAAVAALFGAIWGAGSSAAMPPELLRALAHAGNYVAGAHDGEELVGAVVAFLGLHGGAVHLHSHVAGVLPRAQGRSVGRALKLHQRAWALERGIGQARWTYDPLVGRNAYFNLTRLGATAVAYHADFYGPMDDEINAGEPTDRCVAVWDLASARAAAAAAGTAPEVDQAALVAAGAQVLLAEDESGGPQRGAEGRHQADAPVLLCQVPADIVRLRATRPQLARAWRLALRETLGRALGGGYLATEATRSGWCVLRRGQARP